MGHSLRGPRGAEKRDDGERVLLSVDDLSSPYDQPGETP